MRARAPRTAASTSWNVGCAVLLASAGGGCHLLTPAVPCEAAPNCPDPAHQHCDVASGICVANDAARDAGDAGGGGDAGASADAGDVEDAGAVDAGPADGGSVDAGGDLFAAWSFTAIDASGGYGDDTGHGHEAIAQSGWVLAQSSVTFDGSTTELAPPPSPGGVGLGAIVESVHASDFGTSSFTLGFCGAFTAANDNFDMPIYLGGDNEADNDCGFDAELGAGPWGFGINDGHQATPVQLFVGDDKLLSDPNAPVFHCFDLAVDRENLVARAYRDGARVSQASIEALTPSFGSGPPLAFGGDGTGSHAASGLLDDVVIRLHAVSDVEAGAARQRVDPLFARFSFDDVAGSLVPDVSGNGRDGTAAGDFSSVNGELFGGLFLGDGEVDVPATAADLLLSAAGFTIAFCFEPSSVGVHDGVVMSALDGSGGGFAIDSFDDGTNTRLDVVIGASTISFFPEPDGVGHCYALTGTLPGIVTVFIDGAAFDSALVNGNGNASSEAKLAIGSSEVNRGPFGVVDEVRLYTTALSDLTIAALPPGPH